MKSKLLWRFNKNIVLNRGMLGVGGGCALTYFQNKVPIEEIKRHKKVTITQKWQRPSGSSRGWMPSSRSATVNAFSKLAIWFCWSNRCQSIKFGLDKDIRKQNHKSRSLKCGCIQVYRNIYIPWVHLPLTAAVNDSKNSVINIRSRNSKE